MTILNVLQKYIGNNYKNFKGDIGLEIETESLRDYETPKFSFWDIHNDGSLRDVGREYVLRQPLAYKEELPEALKEFKDKTKDINFVQNSMTTSVHVHLNFLNENFITLGNFFTLYTLVENILIRYSGDNRRSNAFCLPICDAEEIFYAMRQMLTMIAIKKYGSMQLAPEHMKYAALNISALAQYGSLEVRSFRGVTDIDLIYKWVSILFRIVEYSRQKITPPEIISLYRTREEKLLGEVFGDLYKDINLAGEKELIEKNFYYAASLAYSVKAWDKLEEVPKAKKIKPKDMNIIAQSIYGSDFEALTMEQQQIVINTEANMVDTAPVRAQRTDRINNAIYGGDLPLRTGEWTGGTTATAATVNIVNNRRIPVYRYPNAPDWARRYYDHIDAGGVLSDHQNLELRDWERVQDEEAARAEMEADLDQDVERF